MPNLPVTHLARIPDPLKLGRYRKAPELGPSLLFFSGGTALTDLSRILKGYTHNSIHLVTPFDSGGSSAKLRKAFGMPSLGDLRSRLVALADESVTGHPEVYELFTYRFPKREKNSRLKERLGEMAKGSDPLIAHISNPMRRLIRNQLGYFLERMPDDFDLRGASIGNLILAGGYLNNHQHLDPIIFLFSKLVNVLGTVRAIVNDDLHLMAVLENGERIIGQHGLTGKEVAPIPAPIRSLELCQSLDNPKPARASLRKKNRKLIEQADLICYPPGSFYTSLIANLLPDGVAAAIAANPNPKVYIPNRGTDPEQLGMTTDRGLTTLLEQLARDRQGPAEPPAGRQPFLDFVLIDDKHGEASQRPSDALLQRHGIELIETRLITRRGAPYYDEELLVSALLSLT